MKKVLLWILSIAAVLLLNGCGAVTESPDHMAPRFGQCLENGLSAQAVNPAAPADPSPADSLPGDLADKIYKKRYEKAMTEEKKEKEDASSQLSSLD